MFNFLNRKPSPSEITPEEIQRRQALGEQLYIVDVREPDEYAEAHIGGSKLIPLSQLAQRTDGMPHDTPIVVVCRSGNRSSAAQSVLARAGFAGVLNMAGGMIAWTRAGLPVKRGR